MKKNRLMTIPILINGGIVLPFFKKIYLNPFLLAFLIGILGMYFVPAVKEDLYRHYEYFDVLKLENYNPLAEKYFGLSIIMYILKKLKLTKECLPLFSLTTFFYFYLSLIKKEAKKNKISFKKWKLILLFSILVTGVPHLFIYSGIRFFLGSMLMIYGTMNYLESRNIIMSILFFVLGISLHNLLIIYIPIFLVCISVRRKIIFDNKMRLVYFVVILFLSWNFNLKNITIFMNNYIKISSTYTSEITNYGINGLKNTYLHANIYGKIRLIIEVLLYLILPYCYVSQLKLKSKFDNFIINYSYIILLIFKYYDFFRRFTYILGIMISYSLIQKIKEKYVQTYILVLIFLKIVLLIIYIISNYEFIISGVTNFFLGINIFKILL